jgi:GT2 family glycosyltransferase
MPAAPPTRVSAVVLAWGDEPVLEEAVHAVLASEGVAADVVLVDNGCTSDAVSRLAGVPGVTVVEPGENLGFAAGCNLGAARATGDVVAFVNGDAVVRPDALAALAGALDDTVGLATASLRLYGQEEVVNSAGNPVHYLGLSWAGGLGRPATEYAVPAEVASATGAATVCRADRFRELGGFCEPMFAYCEDAELSLRCWQRGWRVVYVPEAVVVHRYEFSRNPLKMYLVERNRLLLVLTLWSGRLLALVLPPLLALELAVFAMAVRGGWARQKAAGWWWLVRNASLVRQRRHDVQAARTVPDAALAHLLTGDVEPGVPELAAPAVLRRASRVYWSVVRRAL